MAYRKVNISDISELMRIPFIGDDIEINGLNLCNRETSYQSILSFIAHRRFFDFALNNSNVKALILSKALHAEFAPIALDRGKKYSYIISETPEFTFYDIHDELLLKTDFYNKDEKPPMIGHNCKIHPSAVIEENVVIGDNVTIGANSVIRKGSIIEDNVTIGHCSIIGSEGFQAIVGYRKMVKHVGGTIIRRGVFIGDNTTIGNALFEGNTEVGEYSKIDNHVHFAHNCKCGADCVITASSLLMGSSSLKDNVWLACNSVILNGKTVEENGFVGTLAFVNKDVPAGTTVIGIPARELRKNE